MDKKAIEKEIKKLEDKYFLILENPTLYGIFDADTLKVTLEDIKNIINSLKTQYYGI